MEDRFSGNGNYDSSELAAVEHVENMLERVLCLKAYAAQQVLGRRANATAAIGPDRVRIPKPDGPPRYEDPEWDRLMMHSGPIEHQIDYATHLLGVATLMANGFQVDPTMPEWFPSCACRVNGWVVTVLPAEETVKRRWVRNHHAKLLAASKDPRWTKEDEEILAKYARKIEFYDKNPPNDLKRFRVYMAPECLVGDINYEDVA